MKQKKKHHHFVAQAYLRGFANNDMLWAWFREPNEVCDVHVGNVAAENYFYDVQLTDGTPCDELEDALSTFDGMTPRIISAAVGTAVSNATLDDVRQLYATTMARNHQGRDLLLPEAKSIRARAERMYDADFPGAPPEERERAIGYVMREIYNLPSRLSPDPATISRWNILRFASELFAVLPTNVCIIRSDKQFFFTSDAPCGYFDASEGPPKVGVTGPSSMSSPTLELTIPLDRLHAAFIANRPLPPIAGANFGTVRVINARTAFFAKRAILAYPGNDPRGELFVEEVRTLEDAYASPLLPAFDEASG